MKIKRKLVLIDCKMFSGERLKLKKIRGSIPTVLGLRVIPYERMSKNLELLRKKSRVRGPNDRCQNHEEFFPAILL